MAFPPAMNAVRRYGSKAGGALNGEQQIADGTGAAG
jgi:hypothetical protein